MRFDQKLNDLLRLQQTDYDAFISELDEPWPGMNSDVEIGLRVLVEYQQEGKTLRMIEDFDLDEKTGQLKVLMPEWQTRMIAEFNALFDESEAHYRFMKTFNEIIGKTMVASQVH